MDTHTKGLISTVLEDRYCRWAVIGVFLLWLLLASPLLTPEAAFNFWLYHLDLFWLTPIALALFLGTKAITGPEERRFWRLLAVAMCIWLTARILAVYWGAQEWPDAMDFVTDVLYVCLYLAILLAMTSRPYLNAGWTRTNPGFMSESVSRVLLVLGVLSYFIVFPAELSWTPDGPRQPAVYMYCLLDLFLLVGALASLPQTKGIWRSVYKCLVWIFAVWILSDSMDLIESTGLINEVQPGSAVELSWRLIWMSQIAGFLVLVRLQRMSRDTPRAEDLSFRDDFDSPSRMRKVLILSSAFVFPTIHIVIYSFGLLPLEERGSRAIAALLFMSLTGVVAYVYMDVLEKGRGRAARRFRAMFDQAPTMAAVIQLVEGRPRVDDCNKLFAETLSWPKHDVLGRSLFEFVNEASIPVIQRALKASQKGRLHEEECGLLTASGKSVQALLRTGPVLIEKGLPGQILVTLVDLTEQRILQEMLSHAQKMESIGRLAGGVAHDFNNSLTVITAYAETALHSTDLNPSQRESLEGIREAVGNSVSLTSQLLNFSRRRAQMANDVDPNEIVRNVEKMLQRIIGTGIELRCELADRLPTIRVDPGQFESSLMNLAINARDAMPQGGILKIQTSLSSLVGNSERRQVKISISDTGVGMDEQTRERIFEPFFTTKGPGKGTGLGLSTVFGFVEQSSGTIRVESSPGQGARFELAFPVTE
ncbi:MAG: PAS domain-containing protein [Acidobacteriota bacterium]|nr:MAG: PAS domain-containing protein [Acidobacteriota bacterium]